MSGRDPARGLGSLLFWRPCGYGLAALEQRPLEVQIALDVAQNAVADHALVAQVDQLASFGDDHSEPEPAVCVRPLRVRERLVLCVIGVAVGGPSVSARCGAMGATTSDMPPRS